MDEEEVRIGNVEKLISHSKELFLGIEMESHYLLLLDSLSLFVV